MKILLLGSSGLVGSSIADYLIKLNIYPIAISRQPIDKKLQNIVTHDLVNASKQNLDSDIIFCSLGTTIKKAKTKENFKDIEFNLVLNCLKQFNKKATVVYISALGSDKESRVFYNKIKGELEFELKNLKFRRLIIIRPSLLIGKRDESRPLESLSQNIFKFTTNIATSLIGKYTPHKAHDVAHFSVDIALNKPNDLNIDYEIINNA